MSTGRRGLVAGAVGVLAAGAGTVLVADHRVGRNRRAGVAGLGRFEQPAADRAGFLRGTDGVSLYYEQDGPLDAPLTVVMAHGFCLDHESFVLARRALVERFGARVRVVVYDQRSHGRSGRSDREHASVDQLGLDLHMVLEAVAPDGPLVLVGHSMGGMTVLALVDARPDLFGPGGRVRGVLLADTSTGKLAAVTLGLPSLLARAGAPFLPLALGGARRGTRVVERGRERLSDVAWVFVKRLSFGPDVEPAVVEFVAEMIGRTAIDVIADFVPALMSHDKLAALKHLAGTPVVVLCGDRDVITPPEHSRAIADTVPGSRLVLVAGTGHLALLERPDSLAGPLADLVSSAL